MKKKTTTVEYVRNKNKKIERKKESRELFNCRDFIPKAPPSRRK